MRAAPSLRKAAPLSASLSAPLSAIAVNPRVATGEEGEEPDDCAALEAGGDGPE
jgi:hypothetical protein